MACYYVYDKRVGSKLEPTLQNVKEGKVDIKADSVEEIYDILAVREDFNQLFIQDPSLIFYDARVTNAEETKAKVRNLLYKYTEAVKRGELMGKSVSDILKENFTQNISNTPEIESQTDALGTFVFNFQTEFGTKINECLKTFNKPVAELNKAIKELVDFIELKRAQLTKNINNHIFPANSVVFDSKLSILKNPITEDSVRSFMLPFFDEFEKYGSDNIEFEVPFYYDSPKGRINGRLDAVIYKDDGSVIIIDFKSSASLRHSINKEKNHYAQLTLYKQILSQAGIPLEKISFNIGHILYGEFGLTPGSPLFGVFSPNTVNQIRYASQVNASLREYFPFTKATVESKEQRQIVANILKAKTTLFTEKYLNRDNKENFKDYIINHLKNNTFYSHHLNEAYTVQKDVDNIILTSLDNKKITTLNFDQFVEDELNAIEREKAETINLYLEVLKSKDKGRLGELISSSDGKLTNLTTNLGLYFDNQWELVDDNPIFNSLGIIVLYNNITDSYDFISLTNFSFKKNTLINLTGIEDDNIKLLLGNLVPLDVLKKYSAGNFPSTISNIETMKMLLSIGLGIKTLNSKNGKYKIGSVTTLSLIDGSAPISTEYEAFINLLKIIKDISENSEIASKLGDTSVFIDILTGFDNVLFLPFSDVIMRKLHSMIFSAYDNTNNVLSPEYISAVEALPSMSISERIAKLKDIQLQLRIENSDRVNVNRWNLLYTDDLLKIDLLLSVLINTYLGYFVANTPNVSGMSIDYDNSLRAGYLLIKNGDVGMYTSSGMLVTGLLQGLDSATPYANPDDTLRLLSKLHTYGTTKVLMEVQKHINYQNKVTTEWLKKKKEIVGKITALNHRNLYKDLYLLDEHGEVSEEFLFRNPFTDLTLTDIDAEYLKVSIWNIYRIRCRTLDSSIKKLTYEELVKNKSAHLEFVNALLDAKNLQIPLKPATNKHLGWEMTKSLLHGDWQLAGTYWSRKLEKSRNWLDPRGNTDLLEKEMEEKIKALEAFNVYNEDSSVRHDRLVLNTPEAFEWNLNFIVNDYVYNDATVRVNQQILDVTDRIIASLRYIESVTGRDLQDLIDAIMKRTKISIYNSNNVDKNYHDLVEVFGKVRGLYNFGVIALRPVLMAKELTVGRIKNFLHASMGYFNNDQISLSSMRKAEAIVFGEGVGDFVKKVSGFKDLADIAKVEALNRLFRVANVDANVISLRTLADTSVNFADVLYYTNIRPDWYNRMAIFVAKMIEDGTWDAYVFNKETNSLEYHMELDKRFSVFWKYKDSAPSKNNPEYDLYQHLKARYEWALHSLLAAEITNSDGNLLKFGDALPIAYTVEETNSIKEITGMLYGYYNHEEATAFLTSTYSNLFLAFKKYLSGELKYYFAIPNAKTSIGKVEHLKDASGNLLYNEDGTPVYGWNSNPVEGLFTSFLVCLGDIFTERGRKDLKTNKLRRRNAETFLIKTLLWAVIAILYKIYDKKEDKSAMGTFAMNVLKKSVNDLEFYHSVIEPVDDLGLVGMDYLEKLALNTVNVLSDGDKQIADIIFKNISAARDFDFRDIV